VLRLVIGSSFRAIGTGAVIGLAIAIVGLVAVSRTEGPTLFGGRTLDPVAMLGSVLFLTAVSALAAYWPARKIGEDALRPRR
jgi:hypothetical protein